MSCSSKEGYDILSSDILRGHLEAILLRMISRADRYGYELFSEISARTQERLVIKEATLYAALQRLEKQGYISSYQGEVSGGSKRRYYHITTCGHEYLKREIAAWHEAREIIDILMESEK